MEEYMETNNSMDNHDAPPPRKIPRVERETRITDVKLHSRLHIYNFVGYDISLHIAPKLPHEPHDKNSKWKKYGRMTYVAAVFGDIEAIHYLNNEIDDNPLSSLRIVDCDKHKLRLVCYILGVNQHWKALKWVVENNYPLDTHTITGAIRGRANMNLLRWLDGQCCSVNSDTFMYAARRCDLEIMKWLRSIYCPWDERTFTEAVKHGNMDNLIWLKSEGCPWNQKVFESAAVLGNRDIMLWLRIEGCPWNSRTFSRAVIGGADLLTLKWMHHEKCPWGTFTFSAAVARGDWNVLKWLREKNCPWDAKCYQMAVEKKNGKLLKWLHEQGCPMNDSTIKLFVDNLERLLYND